MPLHYSIICLFAFLFVFVSKALFRGYMKPVGSEITSSGWPGLKLQLTPYQFFLETCHIVLHSFHPCQHFAVFSRGGLRCS